MLVAHVPACSRTIDVREAERALLRVCHPALLLHADMRFALALPEAAKLGLDVSQAATAAYGSADEDEALGESDFSAVAEVARRAHK